MTYLIYKNLHNGLWSIKCKKTGLVVGHAEAIIMQDVQPKVSEAGRRRVLATRSKVVHAYIAGDILHTFGFTSFRGRNYSQTKCKAPLNLSSMTPREDITYNPYQHSEFVFRGSNQPYVGSDIVILTNDGVACHDFINKSIEV